MKYSKNVTFSNEAQLGCDLGPKYYFETKNKVQTNSESIKTQVYLLSSFRVISFHFIYRYISS
jgi:hypothetical protein